jgi:hypothetical protein
MLSLAASPAPAPVPVEEEVESVLKLERLFEFGDRVLPVVPMRDSDDEAASTLELSLSPCDDLDEGFEEGDGLESWSAMRSPCSVSQKQV